MEDGLKALRKLQAERRKVDGQTEGHLRRARLANEAVGTSWIDLGACKDSEIDSDWWFPGPTDGRWKAAEAKAICLNECSVRLECLQVACLRKDYGIWGGLSRVDRLKHDHDFDVLKTVRSR